MAKRKTSKARKKVNNTSILTYIAWVLMIIALMFSSLVGGYYLGYANAKEDMSKKISYEKSKQLSMLKKQEDTKAKQTSTVNTRLKKVLRKESKIEHKKKSRVHHGASHEYGNSSLAKVPKPPSRAKRKKNITNTKPKLAIIIDDVGAKSHVNAIKSLNLPITMSFLPPSKTRPHSAKLAAKEKIYMVHLPLEAQSYSAEEPDTLRISDSSIKIGKRIKYIKNKFPKVKYINNHTGSKFTSNEIAMNRLIHILNKEGINFIDSRTTAKTKAQKIMKSLGKKYIARDVFLDHETSKAYVKKSIIKAIEVAKIHGSAIAIGHPHANTLMGIHESKHLFKDVELVYVNRLY